MTSRKVLTATRRSLLRGAASGALGVAAVGWIENQTALAQKTPAASPVAPPSPAVELPKPKSLKSADGELNVTLTAMPGVVDMGAPRPVTTYTYDGVVPGDTWEVLPGDTLKIDLVNNLPALTGPMAMTMTRPHMWTTTNLHTHGLHVSPSGNADNVFLEIAPGASQHYEIPIPTNHTGGLFWYHPHKHGAVCQQGGPENGRRGADRARRDRQGSGNHSRQRSRSWCCRRSNWATITSCSIRFPIRPRNRRFSRAYRRFSTPSTGW